VLGRRRVDLGLLGHGRGDRRRHVDDNGNVDRDDRRDGRRRDERDHGDDGYYRGGDHHGGDGGEDVVSSGDGEQWQLRPASVPWAAMPTSSSSATPSC
jgi:hypothetical protein